MKTLFGADALRARDLLLGALLITDGLANLGQANGAGLYDRFHDASGP
jgi:hypothetical protein